MTRAALHTSQIDLWYVPLDCFGEADRSVCLSLLNRSERERYGGFKVDSAKTQFLAARGLVRTTLSRYAPISPDQWRFTTNPYGRPLIDKGLSVGGLSFNLSHTDGMVVCAVSVCGDVGVDVERLSRSIDHVELAETVFTAEESARLIQARPNEKASTFFSFWTLKEAYIKARGMGLSLPMNGFWFDIDAAPPTIHFNVAVADDPRRWAFRILNPTAEHIIAVAGKLPSATTALAIVAKKTRAINLPDALQVPASTAAVPSPSAVMSRS